jgi:type IV secretory pathway VirB3-like protein
MVAIVAFALLAALAQAKQGDPFLVRMALILAVVGLILLFFAKLSLYRQGKFFTFGPKAMSRTSRRVYWTAYAVIGLSVVLMMTLLAVLK